MSEKTTAEFEIKVPKDWIVNEEVGDDGSRVFKIKPNTTIDDSWRKFFFKKVPASELRLADDFMKHQPETERERNFKNLVEIAIKSGLKDYWRPVCDPTYDYKGLICYEPGKMPATLKSFNWWENAAKMYAPEHGSRLCTKNEHIAFLAVLIKELFASGKSLEWAWNAVCNDSEKLGYYINSKDAKIDFEPTGSRGVCGWYDLVNTYKILARDDVKSDCFWMAGGCYDDKSYDAPLADMSLEHGCDIHNYYGCGCIVLDSCPD